MARTKNNTTAPKTATALPQAAPVYNVDPVDLSGEVRLAYAIGVDSINRIYAIVNASLLISEGSMDLAACRQKLSALKNLLYVGQLQSEDLMGNLENMRDEWKEHQRGLAAHLQAGGAQ